MPAGRKARKRGYKGASEGAAERESETVWRTRASGTTGANAKERMKASGAAAAGGGGGGLAPPMSGQPASSGMRSVLLEQTSLRWGTTARG